MLTNLPGLLQPHEFLAIVLSQPEQLSLCKKKYPQT